MKAYAKLNLSLDILGKRPDGFHEIVTVMREISFYDEVNVSVSEGDGIFIKCDNPDVPTDGRNICFKAAEKARERFGIKGKISIDIKKNIPVCSGLAGGSSDGAAVLKILGGMYGAEKSEILSLAAETGSDTPFFIYGGTAVAKGRGERIYPINNIGSGFIALIKPTFGLSTPEIYGLFDSFGKKPSPSTEKLIFTGDIKNIGNMLSFPAEKLRPEITDIKNHLLSYGAVCAEMTGSGSAVYGIFEKKKDAERALSAAKESFATEIRNLFNFI